MRRAGHLMEAVCEPENLRLAFWKASRGKRARADQRAYAANLDAELAALREGLLEGSYPVGEYRRFTIHEPKERTICAAAFRERVLHHGLMNVLEPWVERWLVPDSFACRKGKGQLAAVRRARELAGRHGWFLKCDVRKYFDSIPHEGLEAMLERRIKDRAVREWLMRIVGTYETVPGRGLPIGNLTSQHLANLFLDPLDRWRERGGTRVGGYVRYMDDFVFWSDDREVLKAVRDGVGDLLGRELGLAFKGEPYLNRTRHGMDFLGMRVFPGRVRAAKASLERFRCKSALYGRLLAEGGWDEGTYQARMTALTAFLQQGETLGWRRGRERGQGAGGRGWQKGAGNAAGSPPPSRAGRPRPQRRSEAEEVGVGVLQSFFKMKANISSTESKGPYVGSVPSKTRWRVAAVSAFGVSFASSSSVRVSPGGRASGAGMAGTPLFAGRGLLAEEVGVETGAGYDAYRASTESYRERLRSLSGSSISRCEAWEAFDGVEVVVVGKEDGTGFEGGGGNPDVVDGDGAALAAERRPDEAPADGDPLVGGQDTDAGTGQKGLEGGDVPLEFGPVGEAVIGFRDDGGGDDDLFGVFEKSAHGRMAGDEFGVGVGVDADDHGTGRGRWEGQGAKAEGGRPGHSSGSMRSQSSSMNRSNSAASSGVMMPANSERSRLGLGTAGEKAMERAATAAAFMLRPVSRARSARAVATSSGMLRMVMVFMGCLLFDGVGRLQMQPRTAIKCTEGDGKCKELFLESGAECPQIKRKTVVQTTRGA